MMGRRLPSKETQCLQTNMILTTILRRGILVTSIINVNARTHTAHCDQRRATAGMACPDLLFRGIVVDPQHLSVAPVAAATAQLAPPQPLHSILHRANVSARHGSLLTSRSNASKTNGREQKLSSQTPNIFLVQLQKINLKK